MHEGQIPCSFSLKLRWETHQDRDEVTPPESTLVIAVDVRSNKAAIRIYEKQSDDPIDGVGTEGAGKVVIVPWSSSWVYYCTGSPRVGHILKA